MGHAQIVLSGHDHNLQRHRPQRGLTQYVVGAGGPRALQPPPRQPDAGLGPRRRGRRPAHGPQAGARAARVPRPQGAPARPQPRVLLARIAFRPMDEPVVILCGGRGTRLREAHPDDPEAARGDRRPADPLARDPDLRRPGLHPLRALPRPQGRPDRASSSQSGGLPEGPRHRVRRHGRGDPHRRAHRARARPARGAAASAPPTPTAWRTSTSPRCSTSMRATARSRR